MLPRSSRAIPLALALLSAAALAPGCSSKGGTSTNPTVTGPTFDFSFPAAGTSHELTFTDVGSWDYRCITHGSLGMTGTVVVSTTSTNDSIPGGVAVGFNDGSTQFNFNPKVVTIKPGGKVRWVLAPGAFLTHTVTRP